MLWLPLRVLCLSGLSAAAASDGAGLLPLSAAITLEVELRLLEAGLGEGRLGGAEAAAVALPRWLFEICPGHLRLAAERPRRLRTGGQRAEVRAVHAVVHVPWCAYRGVHESCQLSAHVAHGHTRISPRKMASGPSLLPC